VSLSSLSVKRGVTFGVVWLVVMLFGLFGLSQLKLDLMPDMDFPMVFVSTGYTGASPGDMETLITRPIETAVSSVEAVETVESSSQQGLSLVTVSFGWDTDMDQAETDIRRALDLVDGALPDDADDPLIFALSPDQKPVVTLGLSGSVPLDELRGLAEDVVQPRMERVEGVAQALVSGGLERQIHVDLDPARVQAVGLDLNAVVGALYRENLQEPGGSIEQGSSSFSIQTAGRYGSVDELAEVVVGSKAVTDASGRTVGARPVRLGEVAELRDGFEEAENIQHIDGRDGVQINLRKQSGENTVEAISGVMSALPDLQASLPAGVQLEILAEDSGTIERSLSNLGSTAVIGVLIAFVVLLLFLGDWRAALIVACAIPLSVVATFGLMERADMTLNILSMGGLALAVGMLVDNGVVVLENIFRLREQGVEPREAAARGAGGVSTAVIASTLTTLSVFVPILFVEGFAGMLFEDMALTICFALAVSLVVALSFVPLAASRFLRGGTRRSGGVSRRFAVIVDGYGRALRWALGNRALVVASLVGVMVLTAGLAGTVRTELMASQDNGQSSINVELPTGLSLAETWARVDEVVEATEGALEPGELDHMMVQAGSSSGIAAIFGGGAEGALELVLVPVGDRDRGQAEIDRAVRDAVADIPGVDVRVGQKVSFTGEADIELQLVGHDLDAARRLGLELQQQLEAMPELAEVSFGLADQQPQLQVEFDRPKMAELGLSTSTVGQAISTAFQGRVAGWYSEDGDEHDIVVRWDKAFRQDLDDLRRLPVLTPSGVSVPLDSVADIALGLGPVDITREDQQRISTFEITLADSWQDADGGWHGKDMAGSIAQLETTVAGFELPSGFTAEVGGSADDFIESFQSLGLALVVAIVLVYLVMASQFESLRLPFVIIFSVPLALIGVVLMFAITGAALDISALIGVIMLVGIAVNNGIVMVDAANQLMAEGLDRVQAIWQASRTRLRPVLLTSLTTILAMVPLAMQIGEGSEQWSGMARAVIGGLITATVLTLFLVPVLYTWFAPSALQRPSVATSVVGAK
jgi:hydrophobic/amphiphilic exporter-1 (mainly G- bacteria), HAE1 family